VGRRYHLAVEDDPDPRDLAVLEDKLAAAAAVAAAGAGQEEEFGIFVRDDAGQILAGTSGSIWGRCCQIHTLWVDGPHRGHGLATELIAQAEATARRRGCRLVMGLTYDVLTRGFYDRLGYRTVGIIQDCPAGTTTRWYRKDL
jgi:GNAT superfamily N-acetyltransferase